MLQFYCVCVLSGLGGVVSVCVCCQTEDDYERADRLMNILERRRDSLLTQFYCALKHTDQHDLVQLISYKGLSLIHCWRPVRALVQAVISFPLIFTPFLSVIIFAASSRNYAKIRCNADSR